MSCARRGRLALTEQCSTLRDLWCVCGVQGVILLFFSCSAALLYLFGGAPAAGHEYVDNVTCPGNRRLDYSRVRRALGM